MCMWAIILCVGLFEADIGGNVSLLPGREVDREGEGVEVGESGEGVLTLTLTAVDKGSPIQLTQADVGRRTLPQFVMSMIASLNLQVTILIADINDNPPVFQQPSYHVQVSEALPVNSSIINILATDADSGSNANIVYAIESQQPEPEGRWLYLSLLWLHLSLLSLLLQYVHLPSTARQESFTSRQSWTEKGILFSLSPSLPLTTECLTL